MSTNKPEAASQVEGESEILEVAIYDNHPADALARLNGNGFNLQEYTITPGVEPNSFKLSLIVPSGAIQPNLQGYRTPEDVLDTSRGVEAIRDIGDCARHHLFMVLNGRHAEARLLADVIMRLGGSIKKRKDEIILRVTESVPVIDQLYSFIQGMPGLSRKLRVSPVFESASSRDRIDDLVPIDHGSMDAQREERMLQVTGDGRGSPDIEVIKHLESEKRRVTIKYLSRRPMLPGSDQFEMIIVLSAKDPEIFNTLPPALISDHVGIYGAKHVAEDSALQYIQAVPNDNYDAMDLVRSQKGWLQSRYKRWPDFKPVVAGSATLSTAHNFIKRELIDAKLPSIIAVPFVPSAMCRVESGQANEWVLNELGDGIRHGMRRLLIGLVEEQG